ncbi:MAG: ATP-binding cassette domain-containing protein [Anaerolineae bacterium]|nr:ATP-binding cassette domain-containing protein [Anaerolineae bacterium]
MLLSVAHLTLHYGTLTVLDDIDLTLDRGQRVGLVGANGVGKTSLLRLIAGEAHADRGTVRVFDGVRLGILPQDLAHLSGTVHDLLESAVAPVRRAEATLRDLEHAMDGLTGAALAALLAEYADLTAQYEQMGGYTLEARTDDILRGLGVAHLARLRPLHTLSGGERTRTALAALLLSKPDVLLLDEPTNHLDRAALDWLEGAVSGWEGAALIVSHDRAFLNRTVNRIVEIDEHTHRARAYAGNYDAYRIAKQVEREQWEQAWVAQQDDLRELRRELSDQRRAMAQTKPTRKVEGDKFAKGFFKARTETHLTRKLDNAKERLARIEADPVAKPPKPLTFRATFGEAEAQHARLTVSGLSKGYDGRPVFDGVSFAVGAGERLVLTGRNGSGKTTLLRVLAGLDPADAGEVWHSAGARLGYLDQHGAGLNPAHSVVQAYAEGLGGSDDAHVADLLNWGLFRYDEVRRPVGVLSVGQRRKLQIARLIACGATVLLLDEPTNHLSFDVLELFESALRGFGGAIIAASHDRRFIDALGGAVLSMGG